MAVKNDPATMKAREEVVAKMDLDAEAARFEADGFMTQKIDGEWHFGCKECDSLIEPVHMRFGPGGEHLAHVCRVCDGKNRAASSRRIAEEQMALDFAKTPVEIAETALRLREEGWTSATIKQIQSLVEAMEAVDAKAVAGGGS